MSLDRWALPSLPELGFMNGVSEIFRVAALRNPAFLPHIHTGHTLLIGSDYSGQHKTSVYESMAFVIADLSSCRQWLSVQEEIRTSFLPDKRRFAFKSMNDRLRRRILPAYLEAVDTISGLVLVVLFHKSLGPLFLSTIDATEVQGGPLAPVLTWPSLVLERALKVSHFAAVLLAGLSRPSQHVLWITDADDIVANEARHRQFVALFGAVCSPYLQHGLGHMRIGTTALDTGERQLEDFVSVADLAAGAVCETLNAHAQAGVKIPRRVVSPLHHYLRGNTQLLMMWWANRLSALKRITICIEPGSVPSKLQLSEVDFTAIVKPWL